MPCPAAAAPRRRPPNRDARNGVALVALAATLAWSAAPAAATTPAPPAAYTVSGRVAEFPDGCQGAQRGVTVVLDPLGRTTQTSLADGSFRFADVPPGTYTLRIDYCNPFGCWPERDLTVGAGDVYQILCPVAPGMATPTPPPTPQRTGDLGTKEVSGHVRDASRGDDAGITGARVEYRRIGTYPEGMSGTVLTDADGAFSFPLFLHDTDVIALSASADGFAPEDLTFTGVDLWLAPPLSIYLLPLSGRLEVAPVGQVTLPCEADAEVALANSADAGEERLTITDVAPSNGYSQGDYGSGFTWDLGHLTLPVTLAAGEHVSFPIHYSAEGQMFPSRLQVRVHSSDRGGLTLAAPFRGLVAGCTSPTPTPTRSPLCAGDCDGNGAVTVEELVRAVSIALGAAAPPCASADLDVDGRVAIDELVAAVNAALRGCAAP